LLEPEIIAGRDKRERKELCTKWRRSAAHKFTQQNDDSYGAAESQQTKWRRLNHVLNEYRVPCWKLLTKINSLWWPPALDVYGSPVWEWWGKDGAAAVHVQCTRGSGTCLTMVVWAVAGM